MTLTLMAPLDGWAGPLEEVPDPVFAEKMMGDGLAIDPVGDVLVAPCDGDVVNVHSAGHAVTLRAANGAEILMHIGLETVALRGEGFDVRVLLGDRVVAGQVLIGFDLDLLARRARSLVSPIILANSEAFRIVRRQIGQEVRAGEPLMEIAPVGEARAPSAAPEGETASRKVRITHAHGLHARPAGLIAAEAKTRESDIRIGLGDRTANARSPVALMGLGIQAGDEITVTAQGPDAAAAVDALARLIEQRINTMPSPAPARPSAPAPRPSERALGVLHGVRASPGLAIGPAFRLVAPEPVVRETALGASEELAALAAALNEVKADLAKRAGAESGERRAVLAAHLALLDDPELEAGARRAIAQGRSAGAAWREATQVQAAALAALADERLAARAADLKDLERQVLTVLSSEAPPAPPQPPPGAIVLAEDLAPSELFALRSADVGGLCTAGGGPTSHVAILAAAMDIPALVAAGPGVLAVADGASVVLDADAGLLLAAPKAAELKAARTRLVAQAARKAAALAAAREPCRTADGVRIEVFANVGSLADAETAVRGGAEGCGLLRTEFLFLDRQAPPDEAEQRAAYQAIATAFGGRPVIVRTLDVGGDKPAPYLELARGENPALGLRGVRVSLARPELLRLQLRAILGVEPAGQCRVMIPMVASLAELQTVRGMAQEVASELGRTEPVRLGVMIETPAAAVTADLIAAEADFLSIGTNDLAQYALAMDRGDPALAAEVDALHPAVLRLIRQTAEGGRANGRPVGVCGGLASDLQAAAILIGLGVTELSAAPAVVAELKAMVRTLTLPACQELARQACEQTSAADVRALALGPAPAKPIPAGASR
jgi:phosphocarrier protein FPr/phosphocarrier protein